ncbi:MAG: cold-shock protein [Rikenellaceae bacterium]|nr:cold-shock protein [Rikenellaceae bacterium]MDE6483535.1 cold-shock protein [Rikenellaceae bacterium]
MNGKVKWFDSAKGYGFITTETGNDVFVHYTGINKEGFRGLEQDQNVVFELEEGKKGPQAVKVEVVE